MQLRDAGKLDLEDRLDAHLDVPALGDLTLRRMLSHSSGLQRELPGNVWETLQFPKSTEELVATLGEVVAKLGGMPYEDYVETRILGPLSLTRTSFSPESPTAIAYSVEPLTSAAPPSPLSRSTSTFARYPGMPPSWPQ